MKTPDGLPLEAVFDWYQFSTQMGIRDLMQVLAPMGAETPFKDEKPKTKGYGWGLKIGGRGGSVLVQYGGTNGDNHGPNVQGTGPLAPKVAELVRAAGVAHGVGRVDVRLDFLGDFDKCRLAFIERCNAAGMGSRDNGSCRESIKQLGRSVYGGAVTSTYQPTLYEKGLQLGDEYPTDYLRLEHRFAPTKSAEKACLSMLSPEQVVGLRPVARDLSSTLTELAVQPYKLTKYPKERNAYYWMLKQQKNLFAELLEDHGTPESVGTQIYFDLKEMESEN